MAALSVVAEVPPNNVGLRLRCCCQELRVGEGESKSAIARQEDEDENGRRRLRTVVEDVAGTEAEGRHARVEVGPVVVCVGDWGESRSLAVSNVLTQLHTSVSLVLRTVAVRLAD